MSVLIMILIVTAGYMGIFGWMGAQNKRIEKLEEEKKDDIKLRER